MATKNTKKKTAKKQPKNQPKETKRVKDTWNDISGILTVYGNEFVNTVKDEKGKKHKKKTISWSATLGRKNDDGDYENYYLRVRFGKDVERPNTPGLHQVDVNSGFLSIEAYENRDGDRVIIPVLVVTDCDILDTDDEDGDDDDDDDDDDDEDDDEDDKDDLPF